MDKFLGKTKEKLRMAYNRLIARLNKAELCWTFEDPWGEIYDGDHPTEQAAATVAQDDFVTYCDENIEGVANGHTESEQVTLIQFFYDIETGDRRITQSKTMWVEWEYYHGDYAEHGTWGR